MSGQAQATLDAMKAHKPNAAKGVGHLHTHQLSSARLSHPRSALCCCAKASILKNSGQKAFRHHYSSVLTKAKLNNVSKCPGSPHATCFSVGLCDSWCSTFTIIITAMSWLAGCLLHPPFYYFQVDQHRLTEGERERRSAICV